VVLELALLAHLIEVLRDFEHGACAHGGRERREILEVLQELLLECFFLSCRPRPSDACLLNKRQGGFAKHDVS
jgi:hypothetical protein